MLKTISSMISGCALAKSLALVGLVSVGLPASATFDAAQASDMIGASAVMYHRFGDSRYPSTNVTMEQLDAHIEELTSGNYNVVHLSTIIDAMENETALPPRTVAITIDDAHGTVFDNGWPKLRAAGLPVTLFVSTGPIDDKFTDMMTWDEIRQMQAEGAEIGAHTISHLHMTRADLERNRREIEESNARFMAELGEVPSLFAYPYGEASSAVEQLIRDSGYRAAFGQHSGAMSDIDNRFYLPRFPLNEKYGDMGRFKTAVNAMPIPVVDLTPTDMLINNGAGDANPPSVGFTVSGNIGNLDQLTCFFSHEGAAQITRLGDTRIEVRAQSKMPNGRSRLNCTMPASGENAGRWLWYGRQFMVQ